MYIYYTYAIYMKYTCNIDVRYIHEKYVKHTHAHVNVMAQEKEQFRTVLVFDRYHL